MQGGHDAVLKKTSLAALLLIVVAGSVWWLRTQSAPLDSLVQGGQGPPTLVLLHGYGSRAEDWLQFTEHFAFPPNTRVVFPQAPLRGPYTGQRGWWWLNIEGNIPDGQRFPDFSTKDPGGIATASRLVRNLLRDQPAPLILGGFSQGAMVSAEIAFNSDQELAGLILLGGTPVHEEKWAEHFAGRRRLPIFIAHGRDDGVLAFAQMERFQARLKAFGLDVTWLPFDGGHGIPVEVVQAMNEFVRRAGR